jgi:hypothetical protein
VSWDRPWDTNPVLSGARVLWEPWGVLSVLVERWECFRDALVMLKSRVRIPQGLRALSAHGQEPCAARKSARDQPG